MSVDPTVFQDPQPLPGTPADTPADSQAPAAQPDTRTYAGKYKSPEALEQAYLEAQRKITEESEARRRLEALIAQPYEQPYQAPAPTPGYVDPYTPPADPASDFVTRADVDRYVENKLRERDTQQQNQARLNQEQQYWKDEFFRKNPDLKDDELIVRSVTGEVYVRYQHLPLQAQRALMPTMLDEVANKTREKITHYISRGRQEASANAQAQAAGQVPGSPAPASPASQARPQTVDEVRATALQEEMQMNLRTRQPISR